MSLRNRILQRSQAKGRGWVFVPRDLLDAGTRTAVDQALARLVASGKIRRLGRGIYDYPQRSELLGDLTPTADEIAHAAARSTQTTVQMTGDRAANALGLSLQVPARPTYLTDGPSRTIHARRHTIRFRHAAPRNLIAAGTRAGNVFQALRYLRQDGIDDHLVSKLCTFLDGTTKTTLRRRRDDMPSWMRPVVDKITEPWPRAA